IFQDSTMVSGTGEDILGATIDSSNEIRQEPMEIKAERVDDFVDFKQEEPTADIYSRHITNYRPVDQYTPRDHSEVQPNGKHAERRKCIVCYRRVAQSEMRIFALNHTKRETWINAVRSTPEGRNSLKAQLNAITTPMLCNSHFSPSSFIHSANRTTLRGNA
ncbi:hypothetical protein PMAYCL1PPCAC_08307, partial [Pristionchus mayeri]